MKLSQIITDVRVDLDDSVPDPLCSDETYTRFANEAQNEACRRARLITDSKSDEICEIDLAIGDDSVDLDPRVIFIRRAKLDGRDQPLRPIHHTILDMRRPGWEAETGEPRGYVVGLNEREFRPYPIPVAAGTVHLTVVRLPLTPLKQDGDETEIPDHLVPGLRHYMRHLFYSLPDTEIRDAKAAAEALALFEAEFGKKSSALDEAWLQREADQLELEGNF